jgi:hypothetical protein
MSTALGLAMQISANTAQLATALADVNKRLDSLGDAGKKASSDLSTLKNIEIGKLALGGLQAATTAFLSLGKAVTGTVVSLAEFGKSVADQLDQLFDVSQRTGVNVEALQAYGFAAKLAGTELETFAKSIQKLTINLGSARVDEKAQESFTKLGLVFDDLIQKTPTEQFEAVADAISKITDPAERAAAAVSVFGKGGIELGPLFSEGPGALTKMREEAEKLGLVVSEDAIKSIGNMNDAFDKVFATIKALTGQIVGELAGPIAQIALDLLGLVQAAGPQQIAQNIASGLLDFIQLAGNAFFNLASFIEQFIKKFAPILGIDIRSEAEKELQALRETQARAATGGVVGSGGMGGVGLPQTRAQGLTPEQLARIAELEAQVSAEASQGVLNKFQANFNAAIDTASKSLETRLKDSATKTEPNAAETETVRQLQQINRNGQIGTVDILN